MKLQQLRYLLAIADNRLNITAAAQSLYTSQPGVSKQLKLMEEELGVTLFVRRGKSLSSITPAGERVIEHARLIFREVEQIRSVAERISQTERGHLNIATTQTQARYVLPEVLAAFHQRFPEVQVNLQQGTSEQISHQIESGSADFAIASGVDAHFPHLTRLPTRSWQRVIVVPVDHPLAQSQADLSLSVLAQYPLVSYSYSFDDQSSLGRAFDQAELTPQVVFTASDPDVIKSHVRSGHGVGIIAEMAFDPRVDVGLVALPTESLFPQVHTWIGFNPEQILTDWQLAFIELSAPQWTREAIASERGKPNQSERSAESAPKTDLSRRPLSRDNPRLKSSPLNRKPTPSLRGRFDVQFA